jgi:hypothetical protein
MERPLFFWGRATLGLVTSMALLATNLFAQKTYTVKRTTTPPVIDGVVSAGEWDNVEAEGEWQMLREPETAVDDLGWAFRAVWDDENMYVLLTSDYDDWVLGTGSEFEDEDCFAALNCGGSNFSGSPDSMNLYFDPNVNEEDNIDPPDGYQIAFGLNDGESSYIDGAITNTFVFQEAHVDTGFGNQGSWGLGDGHFLWSFVAQTGPDGGVVEIVFPWLTWDAEDPQVNHAFAPEAGKEWYVNPAVITSDPGNFLPIWNWNSSQSFVTRPDGVWIFSDEVIPGGEPQLEAGDADQNLQFDQLDLVKVQVAAKYLTGQAATWGEGDWDGAPGGKVGDPPPGDGQFNQLDVIAALNSGNYLMGPYAAINTGGEFDDGQTSIVYNVTTGEVGVDAPATTQLTSVNIQSATGIFTGDPAENLGGDFDNDADDNIFKATFGSSFGSLSFGNVAQPGLSEDFVADDLTVVGSLAGGGELGDVDLIYVPEPSTIALVCLGLLGLLGHLRRRP